MRRQEKIVDFICALYIALFLYAAISKLTDYEKFRIQIAQSPMITSMAGLISWLIPAIEIIFAAMLAFTRTRLVALYASFALMVMFSGYIFAILNFTEQIPCSCGGVLEKMDWKEHLVFNVFFVALALAAIIMHTDHKIQARS